MPCFAHDGYHELPPLTSGTTVLLDGPAADGLPVVAYVWSPSEGRCDGHNTSAQPDITITHKGTLTHAIHGFVATETCREKADGSREILYSFAASGADVANVVGGQALGCD